ncbi:nSTAND3 domain-containing NTPase [Clostridium tagluense]|uniref:nSTAND3 domain-containing NTPase n=1 Tax=Clostridium tagluense TaxID=360422 RepID=UPI001C0B439F|nr:hypothetical protein [Clostridium tagluense]MBU3130563.1 hypothetical protein [Clostridium tagluense]
MIENNIDLKEIIDYVKGRKIALDRIAMLAGVTITAVMLGNTQVGSAASASFTILGTSILPEIKKIISLINEKDKEAEATEAYERCRFTQMVLARLAVKHAIEKNLLGKDKIFAQWKLSNIISEQQEDEVRKLDEERELKSIEAFSNKTNYSNDEYWDELIRAVLEVINIETNQVQEFKEKMKLEFVNSYEAFKNQVACESEIFNIYINSIINVECDNKIMEKINQLDEAINSFGKISNANMINVMSEYNGKLKENIAEVISGIKNINSTNVYKVEYEEDLKEYFVKTKFYKAAVNGLQKHPVVILLGIPGVGKTHTSKRICLEYEEKGYGIFYSEEGNIGNIKKYIQACGKEKLLVVLNDFLGQFYIDLNMSETGEFGQLISYIRTKKDIKLLVNSRCIIYNEAMKNRKFNDAIDNNSDRILELSADELNFEEKAWILYNHLKSAYKSGNLSKEQCLAVLENKKYSEIILNEKFNPRIIKYVTTRKNVFKILPQDYVAFINKKIEFPETIWKEEVEKLNRCDRIVINTLFSLTKTCVSKDILKNCVNNRMKNEVEIKDTTINHFDNSLQRLSESMIQVIVSEGKEKIGVLNPSINAYLHESILNNENEVEEIIKYSLYIDQLERFESLKCAKNQIIELINSEQYKKLNTVPRQVFANIPMEFTAPHYMYTLKLLLFLLDESDLQKIRFQKTNIQDFVIDLFVKQTDNIEANSRLYFANEFSNIFCKLFSKPGIFDYDLTKIAVNETYLQIVLKSVVSQDDFWEIINNIKEKYYLCSEDKFYNLGSIKTAIVERIEREVIAETYDELLKEIDSTIEDNIDDFDDSVIDYVIDEVGSQILDIISDSIIEKLTIHSIELLSIDDFDLDSIVNDEINLYDLIESECNRIFNNDNNDKYKEDIEKTVNTILSIFEVDFFKS